MNVWLLYEDSEYNSESAGMNKNEVFQDLNMEVIFKTMSRNDTDIYKTVRTVMMSCLVDKKTVLYRQAVLTDCISNFDSFRDIYKISKKAIEETQEFTDTLKKSATTKISNTMSVLHSLELLGILVRNLEACKDYIDSVEHLFKSAGMRNFYERLTKDYSVEFVEKIKTSIHEMNFLCEGGQITFSATVGQGLKCKDIIVNHLKKEAFKKHKKNSIAKVLFYRLFKRNVIILDDSSVAHDAREMESAGLAHIMKMYQNFIKELTSFFECLHYQTAFYVGCANLYNRLAQLHIPVCMPMISNNEYDMLKFKGLYDLSLAIYNRSCPVCNDLDVEDMQLFIITGANQGGKSTFLRSIGIAQVLMQNGLFVPASYYCSNLYDGIYSHFTRREDTAMNSGKLDEELSRMNRIISSITPGSMLLLNESFATTTEREGSKIASDVVTALYENGTKIWMVTHLFEFTKAMYEKMPDRTIFMSAERLSDGTRTYRILAKEPERTSYGLDLYEDIIGA